MTYFLDQAEELLEAQNAAALDGTPIDTTFTRNPNATGSMAVYQQFMANAYNQTAELTNEYLAELEEIEWHTILDPTRLQSDTNFSASERRLESARQVIEKYKARHIALLKERQDQIRNLDLASNEKRAFEAGFNRGVTGAMSAHEEIWELELSTVAEFGNIIEFLAEEPRFWAVEDGQFMFDTQEQLDQFNGYLETIDEIAERQLEIQKSLLDTQREKLQDF